jgi:hypothetical protein
VAHEGQVFSLAAAGTGTRELPQEEQNLLLAELGV